MILFLHVFYVQSWVVSLFAYGVVYIEILGILFYTYGPKFARSSIEGCIVDCIYYIVLFAAYALFSVFVIRTFEFRERASFFTELNTRHEMECWKALLKDLPEPVILAQGGSITFFNNATNKFLEDEQPKGLEADKKVQPPEADKKSLLTEAEVMLKLEQVKQSSGSYTSLSEIIKSHATIPQDTTNACFTFRKTNKKYTLSVKSVDIKQRNGTIVVEYIVHDITALEELEHEKAQRHCFQVLVATASHDIRNPITAIQGVHDTLVRRLKSEDDKEQLKVAQISVKRMLLYVRGLAYLEHIEHKNLQIDKDLLDVQSTVKEILDWFMPSIGMKKIAVQETYPDHLPPVVSDKEKYETILYHILENAVKYTTSDGRISIAVSFNIEKNCLVTEVKDTGIGITEEQKKYLFKLFAKKHDAKDINLQGIGLGLYLAESLSKELGGQLDLDSMPGIGTTVTFSVKQNAPAPEAFEPASETDIAFEEHREASLVPKMETFLNRIASRYLNYPEDEKRSPSMSLADRELLDSRRSELGPLIPIKQIQSPRCNCPQILMVDDEAMNLMIFKGYLQDLKLTADMAFNGQEAINCVLKRRKSCDICQGYRLIFTDINMPLMNGIEATQEIVNLAKGGTISRPYIVAVTAAAHLEDRETAAAYKSFGFTSICIF